MLLRAVVLRSSHSTEAPRPPARQPGKAEEAFHFHLTRIESRSRTVTITNTKDTPTGKTQQKSKHDRHAVNTLGFLIHGSGAGRKSSILGVWEAPAAPKTMPEGGGGFGAAGAAQTPKIKDFRPAQKPCIKNLSVTKPSPHPPHPTA